MRIGTHNGTFHSDELVACTIIDMLHGSVHLVRTRNPELLDSCDLVLDVGGRYDGIKYFDHHQADFAASRQNSDVPYATVGLVWLHFGMDLVSTLLPTHTPKLLAQLVDIIDTKYIQPIDAIDTGYVRPIEGHYHFSQFLSTFNFSNVNDDKVQLQQFRFAMDTVHIWLHAVITSEAIALVEYDEVVNKLQSSTTNYIILDGYRSWQSAVADYNKVTNNSCHYVIWPVDDGYRIQATSPDYYLPESWRGSFDLANVSDLPSAIFCHKAGFIAGFANLADAIKATHN